LTYVPGKLHYDVYCVIKPCMQYEINNNNNNNNLANMHLGHLLARSGLTRLEVSLMVSPGFFCLSACSYLVFSAIYYGHSDYLLQPVSSVFQYFVQKWCCV